MGKIKKIFSAAVLSILLITAGSTANVNLSNATSYKSYDPGKFYQVKNGLKGEYFSNAEFKGYSYSRIDSRISFDWGLGSPLWGIGPDKFSIRWTGQIQPAYSDTYTFHAITDDGVKLWINGQLIIDEWNIMAATEYTGTIKLTANKKYNIKMEYFENKNDASAKLLWSSKSQTKEIIPTNRLFSVMGSDPRPDLPADPVTVNLSGYFDEDAFSYENDRSDGDYDSHDNTYPAELAENDDEYDNVPFQLGPFGNGKDNSVSSDGQTINLDKDRYSSIRIAGSATNGDKSGVFRINYTDGSHSDISVTMKDWCTSDPGNEKVLQKMNHRHTPDRNESYVNYIFVYYLAADRDKTVRSITLPDENNMHVLAMTLLPYGYDDENKDEDGNGLRGEYFGNMDLTSSKLVRIDPTVDFDWGTDSPDGKVDENTFSVRWTGKVQPQYSQEYTFYTVADDGVRLWVNNKLIINDWTEHAAAEKKGTISVKAGQKYEIKLEFFDNQDKASVKLLWSSGSRSKQVIPENRLYH